MDEPKPDYQLIHADLEHLTEPADLLTQLTLQLARNPVCAGLAERLHSLPKRAWLALRDTVSEVDLYKLKVKLREDIRPRWQERGEELFHHVSQVPERVVFILDEFPMMIDRMSRQPDRVWQARDTMHWLRAVRQHPANHELRFLIAGSIGIGHVLARLGESNTISDFEQVRLQAFEEPVATAFLQELAEGHQLALTGAVQAQILMLAGTYVPSPRVPHEMAMEQSEHRENVTGTVISASVERESKLPR